MKLTQKGFTLIELMIVVVILGVLMSTILPRLTGAQARARDQGRISDINNISAALTVFYDDNGLYPGPSAANNNETSECLAQTGAPDTVSAKLGIYLDSNQVPVDPQPNANTYLCGTLDKGRYWYSAMIKDGIANNSFILCADMETFQKANTDVTDGTSNVGTDASGGDTLASLATIGATAFNTLSSVVGTKNYTAEDATSAGKSQYCILKP